MGGHGTHAGFAALATVTIAALTVIAVGTGAARMRGSVEPPPVFPVVIPGEDSTLPAEQVAIARPSPSARMSGHHPRVTVTATRTLPAPESPPRDGGSPSPLPEPPMPSGGTLDPAPGGGGGKCVPRRPRDCRPPRSPSPVPSPGVSTEPQWGDGESPQPSPTPVTPTPVPSPTPSPEPNRSEPNRPEPNRPEPS
jgi:hypothetical protein